MAEEEEEEEWYKGGGQRVGVAIETRERWLGEERSRTVMAVLMRPRRVVIGMMATRPG